MALDLTELSSRPMQGTHRGASPQHCTGRVSPRKAPRGHRRAGRGEGSFLARMTEHALWDEPPEAVAGDSGKEGLARVPEGKNIPRGGTYSVRVLGRKVLAGPWGLGLGFLLDARVIYLLTNPSGQNPDPSLSDSKGGLSAMGPMPGTRHCSGGLSGAGYMSLHLSKPTDRDTPRVNFTACTFIFCFLVFSSF